MHQQQALGTIAGLAADAGEAEAGARAGQSPSRSRASFATTSDPAAGHFRAASRAPQEQ